jgi:hypothetical protein
MSNTPATRNMARAVAAMLLLLVVTFPAQGSAQGPALVGPGNGLLEPDRSTMEARASADGRFVVFQTGVNLPTVNLPGGFPETMMTHVYLRDMQTGQLTLISINRAGNAPGNDSSGSPMISDGGRFVVFASAATDLVAGSTARGIFVYDSQTGVNSLVAADGSRPFISANGRTIVFHRFNNNILDKDIFAYDMETGATELVTPSHTGGASDGISELPQYGTFYGQKFLDRSRKILSDDGRFVVFTSAATNLVALPDTNGWIDVFVRDLQTDTTTLVSVNSAGTDTGRNSGSLLGDSFGAAISGDGRMVAFSSYAKDLVANSPPGTAELFVRDLAAGATEVVTVRLTPPGSSNNDSRHPSFSRDGRYLAFQSNARDLVTNDTNGSDIMDIFVRDLQTDTTTLVSVNSAGTVSGNGFSSRPQISANGRFVAFQSGASNLDAGVVTTPALNVFVRDLQAGVTRLLSVDSSGTRDGGGKSLAPSITADGELVFFESLAPNLVTKGERFTSISAYAGYITEYFAALSAAPSRLSFDAARYDVGEDGGSVTVTVTRNGATGDAVSADYTTQDGSARAGRDYTATSGTLAFAPGETTKTITVPILDGTTDQPDDAFFVYLNDFNYAPLPTVLSTAMVVIADNDELPTLSIADVIAVEDDSGKTRYDITATISAPSANRVSFTLTPQDTGSATANIDYQHNLLSFSFEPGETTKTFAATGVEIIGERIFELDETFLLNVTSVQNAVVGGGQVLVTIPNDDLAPTIFFNDTTVTEGMSPEGSASIVPFIRLSNPSYLPVTVRFSTADGTAGAGQDYSVTTATLTFQPGVIVANSVPVPIVNDDVAEPTETFFIILSDATNATISDPEGMVTIFDGDAPSVEFALTSESASEGKGTATVRVRRRGAYNRSSATVDYLISDGTATAGVDYAAQTGTLVFSPTEFEKTITFIIADDLVAEGTETVILSLHNPTGGTLLGERTATQLRILDNDGCTFSLNPSALPQFPAVVDTVTTVRVESGSPAGCVFTAVSNSDFITIVPSSPTTVEFRVATNANAASRTGTLTIAGQTLTIRQSGTASGSAFELQEPAYPTVEHAGNVKIKVLRQGDTNGAASVRFRTTNDPSTAPCDPAATQPDGARGTAFGHCDYAATDVTLTWGAGESDPKTITIPLVDDLYAEGTETFRVGLSEPQGGEVGGIGTATVTISDNDRACNYSINSSSKTSPAAGETTTVNVASLPGCNWTAVSNSSFISVTSGASGTGDGTVTLNISANNSGVPRSGTVTIAGQTFTVTQPELTPEVQTLQFGAASYSVGEGEGLATLTVTRTGGSAGAASVDYRTADADTFTVSCADSTNNNGGAFARCDFATTVGRLSFAAGETQKTITVPIINDGHDESAETFQLVLSNPVGVVTLGTTFATTVTIQDNDEAGAPNPVTTSHQFFVRQQYLDFLSREPDTNGFNAWLGVLAQCADPNTGPNVPSQCDRIYVSGEGFFRSQEFQLKGLYVFRFYKVAFNRLPDYLEIISDMSFVAGQTAEEVYARKAQLPTLITQRQEFQTLYDGMTNAQYVSTLLGRYNLQQVTTPDPANPDGSVKATFTADDLINRLNANTLTRAQALRAVADSDAVGASEFNNAFVGMQYYGYLRRKPDVAGFNAWLSVLQAGDVRTMVNGFLNSTEYKLRFGQP